MATRTISVAGGNFNAVGTWDEGIVPVAGDAVVARGTGDSGNLTVNVASGGVGLLSFIMTNYVGTLTMTSTLTVSGTVTLVAGMTITGTGDLICNTTATLTSAGKTWTGGLQLKGASQIYTLADSWTVTGTLISSGTTLITLNGAFNMNVGGGLTMTTAMSGTATIVLNGTGTWSGAGTLTNNLTFNTAGTITVSGTVNYNTGTLTYTAGTVTTTGSTLVIILSTTLVTSGMTWDNITLGATLTLTLTSALNISGTFIPCTGGTTNTINTSTVNISGSLSVNGTGGIVTGTSLFNINGTGTWSHAASTVLRNNMTINTAGTLTVSGTVNYSTGTLTYTTGTVTTTSSTLNIPASATLTTSGIIWGTVSVGVATITLTNKLDTINLTYTGGASVINGAFNVSMSGTLTPATSTIATGTATLVFTGTGNWATSGGGLIGNNVTFNTAGTITIGVNIYFNTGTLTYISGTIVTTSSTLNCLLSATLNVASVTWNNILFGGSSMTYTLSANLNASGLVTAGGSVTVTLNGSTVNCGGWSCTNPICAGTTAIIMNGTGTLSSSLSTSVTRNTFTINTAGTITVGALFAYNTGTFTYTAGTVITTSSILCLAASTTLNVSGIVWNDIQFLTASQTCTLLSDLNLSGLLTFINLSITTTVNGAFYINCTGSVTHGNGNTVTGTCLGLNLTGTGTYANTGTATQGFPLTINTAGTVTFNNGINLLATTFTYTAGTCIWTGSTLRTYGAGVVLTLGAQVINDLNMTGLATYTVTLSADLNVGGNTTMGTNGPLTINGFTLKIGGDLFISNNVTISGTTAFLLNGTGSWYCNANGIIANAVTINTAGTITIGSGLYRNIWINGGLTHISGTVITDDSLLVINATQTLDIGNIIWCRILHNANSITITLLSDLKCYSNYTASFNTVVNGFTIYVGGSISLGNAGHSGTSPIVLNGTGTWSTTLNGFISSLITINTTGTITIFNASIGSTTLTLVKGTVVADIGTLKVWATSTIVGFSNVAFLNIIVVASITLTLDKMFNGKPGVSTRIQSNTTATNYTILFQTTTTKKSFFTKVSNCTVAQKGQLCLMSANSNYSKNVNVTTYENTSFKGFALSERPSETGFGFSGSNPFNGFGIN